MTAATFVDQLADFCLYVEEVSRDKTFTQEFRELREYGQNIRFEKSCDTATTLVNMKKNRYKDILPFDENRIQLHSAARDYINASKIETESGSQYIAAQGPLPSTIADFWQAVWQENVTTICMLCVEMEAMDKKKCERYWPEAGETMRHGPYTISGEPTTPLDAIVSEHFVVRRLILQRGAERREISHWQYLTWPDHDTPRSTSTLLHLLSLLPLREKAPLFVHCSAGCGRTGIFIAVHSVLVSLLSLKSPSSLLDVAKSLRRQRVSMIQTVGQYEFVALSIQHMFLTAISLLPASASLPTSVSRLASFCVADESTAQFRQFLNLHLIEKRKDATDLMSEEAERMANELLLFSFTENGSSNKDLTRPSLQNTGSGSSGDTGVGSAPLSGDESDYDNFQPDELSPPLARLKDPPSTSIPVSLPAEYPQAVGSSAIPPAALHSAVPPAVAPSLPVVSPALRRAEPRHLSSPLPLGVPNSEETKENSPSPGDHSPSARQVFFASPDKAPTRSPGRTERSLTMPAVPMFPRRQPLEWRPPATSPAQIKFTKPRYAKQNMQENVTSTGITVPSRSYTGSDAHSNSSASINSSQSYTANPRLKPREQVWLTDTPPRPASVQPQQMQPYSSTPASSHRQASPPISESHVTNVYHQHAPLNPLAKSASVMYMSVAEVPSLAQQHYGTIQAPHSVGSTHSYDTTRARNSANRKYAAQADGSSAADDVASSDSIGGQSLSSLIDELQTVDYHLHDGVSVFPLEPAPPARRSRVARDDWRRRSSSLDSVLS